MCGFCTRDFVPEACLEKLEPMTKVVSTQGFKYKVHDNSRCKGSWQLKVSKYEGYDNSRFQKYKGHDNSRFGCINSRFQKYIANSVS